MKILNVLLILALVFVPIYSMVQPGHWATLLIAVFAIMSALFFVNLDKFDRFKVTSKLLSLEADLRKTIDQAYAAIKDLKDLALALAEPMIADLTMSGQIFRSLTVEYKLESVGKIADTLLKLGASDKEIEQSCGFIYKRVSGVLANVALVSIRPEKWEELDFFKGFSDWDFPEWNRAKIEKFAKENALPINDEAKEWLEDIDYFAQTKKLRRPDAWDHGWQL
jgi:hypothetical protein